MNNFRFLTAGESHGKCLTAIIEGVPAGITIDVDFINNELKRRQQGYGRGERMQIENDTVEITSGVRFGKTLGSPITLVIQNRDFEAWKKIMSVAPEDITDEADVIAESKNVVKVAVDVAELLGATTNIHFDMNSSHVCAAVSARADIKIGDELKLAIDMEKCHFFDPETQLCVTVPFYVRPTAVEE